MANDTLTQAHTLALALAGEDYTWRHADAPKSKRSDEIAGLVALLTVAQGGICAACGDTLAGEATQFCHLVSAPSGRGFMPGNGYIGHVDCNTYDRDRCGRVVAPSDLVRADLVQTEWPSRQACLAAYADRQAARAHRADMRDAHRGA